MRHGHIADPVAIGAAALTMLLWSSSYPAISYGLRYFTPGELILLRFSVASAFFVIPVATGWIRLPPRGDWPAVVVLALIGNTAYQLSLGFSMTSISPGAAAVVIGLAPAVTSLLAVLKLKERVGVRAILGLAVAFAGTVLVTLGQGDGIHFEPVALLAFVAVLCNSSYFVWQKPLLTRTNALGFTAAAMFVGTVSLLPFGWHLPEKLLAAPHTQIYSIVYLGLFPTVIGFASWSFALSRAPASQIAGFLYLSPVGTFIIAWLWLGDVPAWLTIAGAVLTLGGVLFSVLRLRSMRMGRLRNRFRGDAKMQYER